MDRKYWTTLLSLGLSIAVLVLFITDANERDLLNLLKNLNVTWLVFALFLKGISLAIHEYRLWLGFAQPRPPLNTTMQIGFSSALLNILFPGRAGDIAAIALLHKRCGVPVGVATYAVGIVGFFEGAAFGLMMIFVLFWQSNTWSQYLGSDLHQQSIGTISGLTLLAIATPWI